MIFEEVVQLGGEGYVLPTARGGVDRDGKIWLGQYRDMVKVFTDSGRLVRTVGRRGEGPGEFVLPNHVVLVHQLRRDWREHTVEATSGPDTRLLPQEQDLSNWFRARLDVFDVTTGELVASELAPILLSSFIGTNVAVENRLNGAGQPTVVVWRIHTNAPQGGDAGA